jgi:hypothetical protein
MMLGKRHISVNEREHEIRSPSRDHDADFTAERVTVDDGRFGHRPRKKGNDVVRVVSQRVSTRDMTGLAMSAKIRSENVPIGLKQFDERLGVLPTARSSVKYHERWPVGRSLAIVEFDNTGVKSSFL